MVKNYTKDGKPLDLTKVTINREEHEDIYQLFKRINEESNKETRGDGSERTDQKD